ncbi:MAG: endonuclease III [Thermodesulfobacteriota bacterium]|nr:endonuclease III [Thermodesulfobacteriota bacterium]
MDIELFMEKLKKKYPSWDAPVITLMARRNSDPFQILISTLISLRTKDEVTINASKRLFKSADTPEEMIALGSRAIAGLIYPAGFYTTKAGRIVEISEILIKKYNSRVPDTMDGLLSLPGVGRKTANLVLVEAFGKNGICVDTHVHRISNRTGYIESTAPDKTEAALRKKLPVKFWKQYNEILVAFGQVICRPVSPWCSKCPVSDICMRKGVVRSR